MYFTNGNFEKAVEYLEKGVGIGSNNEEKADMYYELAYINYVTLKDYQTARLYARKASELRPNWGDPYILVGKMYIDDRKSVSGDSFEQAAVFWAAVDQFIKAKQLDPEQSQKANDLIYQYSQYFPINEDVFMYTLKDGEDYKVGGWINETTTVRSRKN
jgi:tetratricopeptide (TPR) repeat protein